MDNDILKRIIRRTGVEDIIDILAERLSPTDLQSLLLEVYRKRAGGKTAGTLLKEYMDNRFVKPSDIDPRRFQELEQLAYSLMPKDFQPLEISPVCPLGTCSAMAPVDQNRVVSTARNTEVVADATNVLALECARRRKALLNSQPKSAERVKLCASHRHTRTQPCEDEKFTPHFKILCLCSAGRDEGDFRFETENLVEHIDFHLNLLQKILDPQAAERDIAVSVTDLTRKRGELIQEEVLAPLGRLHPSVRLSLDPNRQSALNYYDSICFNIAVRDGKGSAYDFVVDGGFTDWTRKLLSNRKERLLTSGLGSELLYRILHI